MFEQNAQMDAGAHPWQGRGRLEQLAEELERQRLARFDFVADPRNLIVDHTQGGQIVMMPAWNAPIEYDGPTVWDVSDDALEQIGSHVSPTIPVSFIKALAKERPAKCVDLVNGLMWETAAETGKQNLIRILDGRVRSVLSDRYRMLDSADVVFAALGAAKGTGARPLEASLDNRHMRLKLVNYDVAAELDARRDTHSWWRNGQMGNRGHLDRIHQRPGDGFGHDVIHPVVTISNSETGHGRFSARIGILLDVCTNLAIIQDVVSEIHLGSRHEAGIIYSETTKQVEGASIIAKAIDTVKAAFDPARFSKLVELAQGAAADTILDTVKAVDHVVDTSKVIRKEQRDALLQYFTRDYQPTRFGLSQAVARLAQDVAEPGAAAALEDEAGRLILAM